MQTISAATDAAGYALGALGLGSDPRVLMNRPHTHDDDGAELDDPGTLGTITVPDELADAVRAAVAGYTAEKAAQRALVLYANARQWALATGGFVATIEGRPVPFATTESALGLMDGKVMRLAQPNPPASVNWQVGPTDFLAIAADDFVHAATLVSDFVQATFDALPAIFAGIASGAIADTAAVDAAAWPAPAGTVP